MAEAGFFPGVLLYITYWFPPEYRARFIGLFQLAIPMASVLGSPLSGAILNVDQLLGLKGGQWLYLLEAAPAILLGIICFFCLSDRPSQAGWLLPDERAALQHSIESDLRKKFYSSRWGIHIGLILDRRVLYYAALFFTSTAGSAALSLWLPQIVRAFRAPFKTSDAVLSGR